MLAVCYKLYNTHAALPVPLVTIPLTKPEVLLASADSDAEDLMLTLLGRRRPSKASLNTYVHI